MGSKDLSMILTAAYVAIRFLQRWSKFILSHKNNIKIAYWFLFILLFANFVSIIIITGVEVTLWLRDSFVARNTTSSLPVLT